MTSEDWVSILSDAGHIRDADQWPAVNIRWSLYSWMTDFEIKVAGSSEQYPSRTERRSTCFSHPSTLNCCGLM